VSGDSVFILEYNYCDGIDMADLAIYIQASKINYCFARTQRSVDLENQRRKILRFLDPKSEGKTTNIHCLLDPIRLDGDAMAVFVSHAENVDSQKLAIHPPVLIIIAFQFMAQITNRKDFDGSHKRCNPLPCQLAKRS
jgi:hypothetical protein